MKKIFFIIPLLFINLSFNCINLYNNKTLIILKKILYLSGGTTSNGAVALKILYTIYYFTK